jgi:hypothetical protein
MKLKKKFTSVFLVILCLLLSYITYLSINPYSKIRNADYRNAKIYLSLYETFMTNSKFDSLLTKLIIKNNDLKSVISTVDYITKGKKCNLIIRVQTKLNQLKAIPIGEHLIDTTFSDKTVEYSPASMSNYINILSQRIEDLKSKCNYSPPQ